MVPGRGKGGRKGTKVRSWIWAGEDPTAPKYTKRGAGTQLPVAKCNLPPFSGPRGWGRGNPFASKGGGEGRAQGLHKRLAQGQGYSGSASHPSLDPWTQLASHTHVLVGGPPLPRQPPHSSHCAFRTDPQWRPQNA